MDKFDFHTKAKLPAEKAAQINRILNAAIVAVDPYQAIRNYIRRENKYIFIKNYRLDLANIEHIYVIGAGKAGAPMAQAVEDVLGSLITEGIVIIKEDPLLDEDAQGTNTIRLLPASHPIPDDSCIQSTSEIIRLLDKATKNDLVLCLLSGGGSSLLTAPLPSISLSDLQVLTNALLRCGAFIHEINTLRKHLSQVKGGGLAKLAYPSKIISLILSDVVGDQLDVISSGPTAADSSTFQDCLDILEHYNITRSIPQSIVNLLKEGANGILPETLKPDDPIFNNVINLIVGNNLIAAQAAREQAQLEGFHTMLLTTQLQGEAREAGKFLASIARQINITSDPVSRPACIICGGETTVTLTGDGLGGRNIELALSTVPYLDGLSDTAIVTLATDGDDGPTRSAGAIVTEHTLARASALELDYKAFLANNDSFHFFEPLGNLMKPGLTQTNVNDLAFIFTF